ncbi:hypothetical protein NT01EI_0984 [Edwardsiella ictaluri 93-146]|uniref:Uncharacterized protein n=1 Tax=Edwardsiella ictaluri (strain 93-146) TaxID=634503 RepID=C5BBG2_EDWI9|nr:hypothetical protein NT01EI_0984 [Edwardsiella ictaluri 93-146]
MAQDIGGDHFINKARIHEKVIGAFIEKHMFYSLGVSPVYVSISILVPHIFSGEEPLEA